MAARKDRFTLRSSRRTAPSATTNSSARISSANTKHLPKLIRQFRIAIVSWPRVRKNPFSGDVASNVVFRRKWVAPQYRSIVHGDDSGSTGPPVAFWLGGEDRVFLNSLRPVGIVPRLFAPKENASMNRFDWNDHDATDRTA